MNHIKVYFTLTSNIPEASEILIAHLGGLGFESFVITDSGFEAYIAEEYFNYSFLSDLTTPFSDVKIKYKYETIPDQNWNKTWEENFFEPIVIGNDVMIRGSFHKKDDKIKHDIVIDPKMAFGTGHHETTSLMIKYILEQDFKKKTVLDMGCGTGILGILCSKLVANEITGVDIEEWAYNNAIENCKINSVNNMEIMHGNATKIEKKSFDIILANINRNILLEDISQYSKAMYSGSLLILSGFYETDLKLINGETKKHKLSFISSKSDNNWVASSYRKEK